jgi:hypothetical protein
MSHQILRGQMYCLLCCRPFIFVTVVLCALIDRFGHRQHHGVFRPVVQAHSGSHRAFSAVDNGVWQWRDAAVHLTKHRRGRIAAA